MRKTKQTRHSRIIRKWDGTPIVPPQADETSGEKPEIRKQVNEEDKPAFVFEQNEELSRSLDSEG